MNLKKIIFARKIWLLIVAIILILIFFFIRKNNSIQIASKELDNTDIRYQAESKSSDNIKPKNVVKKEKNSEEKIVDNLLENFSSDVVFGNMNAPITIIEYSSFICSYCIKMHNNVMDKLKKEYIDTNKVKFVHRAMINPKTIFSKMLQHCVKKEYSSDLTTDLFNTSGEWAYSENLLDQLQILAFKYEMSEDDFNKCIHNKQLGQGIINRQLGATRILKVNSTPTLFINKERFIGSRSYKEIKRIIDKKLLIK